MENKEPLLLRLQEEDGKQTHMMSSLSKEFISEWKNLWPLAGPAIFTSICQYSLGAFTLTFAGSLGEIELAAVSIADSVIAGLSFGVMLGMASALETLCGQAFGAGKTKMLGIYMQRSWLILLFTALLLTPIYIFAHPILKLFGVTEEISQAAARYSLWMIPQLFAYSFNFPIQKFLQAQGKVSVMAWISAVLLVLHALLSWNFMLRRGWGLVGAAVMLNISWWLLVVSQFIYILITNSDGAWSGFSWLAFSHLFAFVKLSLASGVMLCLEFWYFMLLVVITGRLTNPLIPVDAISICVNIEGWDAMIAVGFNAAISVRVSNELGAGNHRQAKISVIVVSITSLVIGLGIFVAVLTTRDWFPYYFTSSDLVAQETTRLSVILALSVLLNSLQPVLSGVAIGAGWQSLFAYINIGCYYLVGMPVGILLGFKFGFGVMGVWAGMISGICLQTLILIIVTAFTNWKKEADEAETRIRNWGGSIATLDEGNLRPPTETTAPLLS